MDQNLIAQYALRGWHVERGLFSGSDAETMIAHYMRLRASGPLPGDSAGVATRSGKADPNSQFPRMINMQEWDDRSREWMQNARMREVASALIGQQAELTQSMLYFKPAGARGQGFHQDNLYLRVTPLMGVWVALDKADAENGAMEMITGSHLLGILPVEEADTERSFTANQTCVPSWLKREVIELEPGDAVYFGGLTIHGSGPNVSSDRFRRAFICHFQGRETLTVHTPEMYAEAG